MGPAQATKQESVSAESESEEEAEYHPNVSVSISHTQIPEEKEEEGEQEKTAEQDTPAPDAPPAEVGQPVEVTSQEGEEPREEEADAGMDQKTEKEREGERETEESTDDPMVTPEEAPNGLTLPEEVVTDVAAPAEEEKEPKMNGEASVVEAEPRPQVICCSEVKSSLGQLRSFSWASILPTSCRNTPLFFLPAYLRAGFLPACVNIEAPCTSSHSLCPVKTPKIVRRTVQARLRSSFVN